MISDPASSSPLVAGVAWIEHALLGTAATSIAVICVAGVGYQFLTGRVPARRAITVILGCFILFGAPGIAAALGALASRGPVADTAEQEAPLDAPRRDHGSRVRPWCPYSLLRFIPPAMEVSVPEGGDGARSAA